MRSRFERRLALLGAVNVMSFLAYTLLSYGMTAVAPFVVDRPVKAEVYRQFAESVAPLGAAVQAVLRGESALAQQDVFLMAYMLPFIVSSAALVGLLALLARHRSELDDRAIRSVMGWATAFAVVVTFAAPVLVEDFWLSPAWGRMVANGINPYHTDLTTSITRGLPLDIFSGQRMTYGPLWAVASGALMMIAGNSAILAGLLFKAVLLGFWLVSLRLVQKLLRRSSPWHQCAGIAVFGWLPLSIVHTMGDGHNDVAVVLLVLLWLFAIEHDRPVFATMALAGSVLVKYVTAPLFLLDFLHLYRGRKRPWKEYFPHVLVAAGMAVVLIGAFYRSPDFFSAASSMRNWHFYTPRDAIAALGGWFGIKPSFVSAPGLLIIGGAALVLIFFLMVAVSGIIRYWHRSSAQEFRLAIMAVFTGIFFGVLGHIWPWFFLWGIASAALVPFSLWARWMLGVSVAAPFAMVMWTTYGARTIPHATIAMYAFALVWVLLIPEWQVSALPNSTDMP
ncbi:MAG: hypothetical protein ACR2G6_17115 [Gemmatimonadaceae bacterium]